jgi:hypothetical protein
MIPHRAIFLLAGLLAAPAVLAADGPPPLGIIDFYGVRKASVERLREALAIRVGDAAPNSADAVAGIVKRLQRVRHVSRAAIELVCCQEGQSILFVGVEERGARRLTFRPRPSSDIRLPEDISTAYDRLMDAWMVAVQHGGLGEEDYSQGHSLVSDPDCRRIQEQFVTFARANLDSLRRVLQEAGDGQQRTVAAWVIGYASDKAAVAADLQAAMRDPDSEVRNNAVRGLGVIAHFARLHPELGIRIPYESLVGMLDSLFWSDRNKSLFVLQALTAERDREVIEALRRRSIPALVEMARFRSQFAPPAFTLLGRVAGVSEEEIQEAWQAEEREKMLARILSGIEKAGGQLQRSHW